MDIRSTRHGCIVTLRNGLSLELCYDLGEEEDALEGRPIGLLRASQGVWMFREEVMFEVQVGQA